jgi:hypothetical protein
MSGAAIRSQAPFNVQRKVTTATSASDNPMVKKIPNKRSSNRLKKDTAQSGSIRPNAKLLTEQSPNHNLALVDTLQVRMPAPSDTSVHESPLSSSIENVSNDDLEGSSSFDLNTSLGRDMTDIMLEVGFSKDLASDNIDRSQHTVEDSLYIQSPSIIETSPSNVDSIVLRDSPTPLDDGEKYTHDLTQFIKDHEVRNWTPRNKGRNIEIHAENIVDPPNTTHNINDIEQRQVRQFVEKLKRAVSTHSIKENDMQLVTKDDSRSETRRNSDQALHSTNISSIWDEPKPFPSDLSDNGSEEHLLETPSFSAFQRPQLNNRQSSDADINATWVKDQNNAPIGWLSRHQKGNFVNTEFACPVPAKYIPRIKQDLHEMISHVSIETNEEAKSTPCEATVTGTLHII